MAHSKDTPPGSGTEPSPGIPAISTNTLKAYKADWAHFTTWCNKRDTPPLPPSPKLIGLYLKALAAPGRPAKPQARATIERRLFGLDWNIAQRGHSLDRQDPAIRNALNGIREAHIQSTQRKASLSGEDIRAMVATLPHDLRGLRDRAILLIGFSSGLRRSEIVGLDADKDLSNDACGWVEIMDDGLLVTLLRKSRWREVEIARGSSRLTCPVRALEQWLYFSKITNGPLFTRVTRDGKRSLETRLSDKHVVRLIKSTVLAADLRSDLPRAERQKLFSGASLRNDLVKHLLKDRPADQLGPGGAADAPRFQINLTRALGL